MRVTKTNGLLSGASKIIIEITETDVVTAKPTRMEMELLKQANKTKKISDQLLYLSELAKNIEDKN